MEETKEGSMEQELSCNITCCLRALVGPLEFHGITIEKVRFEGTECIVDDLRAS